MLARVYVTPRQGVRDPQGAAIQASLRQLGYAEVSEVRMGKYLEVQLTEVDRETAASRVDEMCQRLLANAVIEEYRFEIEP